MSDYTELQAELAAKKAAGWQCTDGLSIDKVLALIAQIDQDELALRAFRSVAETAIAERDQLKAENESLRKDADRFRRMRAMTLAQIDDTQDEFDAEFDRQLGAALRQGEQS